jgi:hypothetical protein
VLKVPVARLMLRVDPNYLPAGPSTSSIATIPAPAAAANPLAAQAAVATSGTREAR